MVQLLVLSSCSGEAEQWRSELLQSTSCHLQPLSSVEYWAVNIDNVEEYQSHVWTSRLFKCCPPTGRCPFPRRQMPSRRRTRRSTGGWFQHLAPNVGPSSLSTAWLLSDVSRRFAVTPVSPQFSLSYPILYSLTYSELKLATLQSVYDVYDVTHLSSDMCYNPQIYIQGGPKKVSHKGLSICLPNIDRFSKFFHCCILWTICSKMLLFTKHTTTP